MMGCRWHARRRVCGVMLPMLRRDLHGLSVRGNSRRRRLNLIKKDTRSKKRGAGNGSSSVTGMSLGSGRQVLGLRSTTRLQGAAHRELFSSPGAIQFNIGSTPEIPAGVFPGRPVLPFPGDLSAFFQDLRDSVPGDARYLKAMPSRYHPFALSAEDIALADKFLCAGRTRQEQEGQCRDCSCHEKNSLRRAIHRRSACAISVLRAPCWMPSAFQTAPSRVTGW